MGRKREHTFFGTLWRRAELADHTLGHFQLWKASPQRQHIGDRTRALMRLQHFREAIADLRRKQAEPYPANLCSRTPKLKEFTQVTGTFHHLAGDGAMDSDVLARDVLKNAIVGCWRSPNIMLWLQPF